MRTFPRVIFATAIVAACSVFVSTSASAQTSWTPGEPSSLAPTSYGTSCSISFTRSVGEDATSWTAQDRGTVYGICQWSDDTSYSSRLGRFLASATVSSFGSGYLNMCTTQGQCLTLGGPTQSAAYYPKMTNVSATACNGVPRCIRYAIEYGKTTTLSNYGTAAVPPCNTGAGCMFRAVATDLCAPANNCGIGNATSSTQCGICSGAELYTLARAAAPLFGSGDPSRYYWGTPYVTPVPVCGTDAQGPLYTGGGDPPKPTVTTGGPDFLAVVQPGQSVTVTYPKLVADGQVSVKWADEGSFSWRPLRDSGTAQSLVIARPSTSTSGAPARNLVFRCVRPANSTPLYSQFVQSQVSTGAGAWAVFTTSPVGRPCGSLTISDLPRTGYQAGTTPVPFSVSSSVPLALGDVVVSYDWGADKAAFPSSVFAVGTPVTFTIPASTYPDRYFERLRVMCTDSTGLLTMRGNLATNDIDPLSTDIFPDNRDLDACFTDTGIGLNPQSWVPAAGRMGSCVLTTLFIPGSLDFDALRRRIVGSAGAWAEPITAIAAGVTTLTGTTGSCNYSVTLPINGGLLLPFDSCTGGLATGRELVYTASSVSTALFGGLWLKRKAVSVLTLNSAESARNEFVSNGGKFRS